MFHRFHGKAPHWRRNLILSLIVAGASFIAFFTGQLFQQHIPDSFRPTRLSGYEFISPLLTCNSTKIFPEFQALSEKMEKAINAHKSSKDISKASTFFFDLKNGRWSDTFPSEKYYPSSLGKIPIMIAYFELAEKNPGVLDRKLTYAAGGSDFNLTQDISPSQGIIPGRTYAVKDLMKYMIEDSDNNAAQLLYENIDQNALRNVYNDFQIPFEDNVSIDNLDFITPQQISVIFRVLYNATYILRGDSGSALQLLSQSSFDQGLVAGVPNSTVVAHKFGLVGIAPKGITTEHELHDCGIVYAQNHPYFLCVMTRGSSSIENMENTIADISRTVYQEVER